MKDQREIMTEKAQVIFNQYDNVHLEWGTGTGKTKAALHLIEDDIKLSGGNWDIVVPNTKLISGWFDEIKKWGFDGILKHLHIYCYASLHKYGRKCNVVLDEVHKLTDLKLPLVERKLTVNSKLITASASMTPEKRLLVKQLGINKDNTIKYTLDKAVADDLVTDYKIDIVELFMDNKDKVIPAGTKANPFMVTEQTGYDFVNKRAKQALMGKNSKFIKYALLDRMHYIYNLPSKTAAGSNILKLLPKDKKVLIFCASIAQANAICKHRYHSKTDDVDFERFCKGEINRLAVVNSISEGINIPELDYILLLQLQSNQIHAIQKIGRLLRKTSDPNKIGRVLILSAAMTQDSKWIKKALVNFDQSKISYISYNQILHAGKLPGISI